MAQVPTKKAATTKRAPVKQATTKKKAAKKPAAKKKVPYKHPDHPLLVVGPPGSQHDVVWNRELVIDHICDQIVCSSRGIGNILTAGYEGYVLPSYSTVMKWLTEDESLSERYAGAKEAQADYMADEILDIADDGMNDWMEKNDKDGACIGYQLNGEHVQRSRLRIDSRKWLASKLKAKKYGDKLQQEITVTTHEERLKDELQEP